ncbi:hypothetical protein [Bacillus xiapuensis]|uniref:Uncharacterized protein n=1 Tax=Bacillus xiapuensis TaxID=2014075 RepID=A0ABU6N795_9BACI|nr:hypothetical protein [Bacillus xiapuensis]
MPIYYFTFDAIPFSDNPEKKDCAGAYVCCWVDSIDVNFALAKAKGYMNSEGWEVIKVEEQFIATREQYENDPENEDALECYDEAVSEGESAIFYIWPYDD